MRKNVFPKQVNKIALSANDDKRIQSCDSVERYTYGTNKEILQKKEEIKCNNRITNKKKWLNMTMSHWKR